MEVKLVKLSALANHSGNQADGLEHWLPGLLQHSQFSQLKDCRGG